jgi:hypothetical protein
MTLREEHRLRALEKRVLRRIFGLKRDNMVGGWRTLHNEELIRMIQSRSLRWVGNVAHVDGKRNAYKTFVVKPEGKRPLGRLRRRWEDNIKIDIGQV